MWISVGELPKQVHNFLSHKNMLIGQYEHTIDNKKRLALPAKFRGELGDKVIITKGVESCLGCLYRKRIYNNVRKIKQFNNKPARSQKFYQNNAGGSHGSCFR